MRHRRRPSLPLGTWQMPLENFTLVGLWGNNKKIECHFTISRDICQAQIGFIVFGNEVRLISGSFYAKTEQLSRFTSLLNCSISRKCQFLVGDPHKYLN